MAGEKVSETFLIKCKFGKGILYVTNFRVLTEINKKGLILDLNYNEFNDMLVTRTNSIRFSWTENIGYKMSLEIQCKDAQNVIDAIRVWAKQDFDTLQKAASK